jgi:acyl-CoA carboxylase subunit alpha
MISLPIQKLLIANRGEIAVRIARTAREMGIRPLMVYSDADTASLHARAGDEACRIGPSYLDIDAIVAAARKAGADAVHPGYGFLAEKADFAEACERGGLIFVGPRPEAIRSMGMKTTARDVAASAGVPVVPAFHPKDKLQFPVLVKAAAGGGGRGMRIVAEASLLDEALESARSEAERAFGDGSLLIERYIEDARHVEFQIAGDQHGALMHLYERDCSVQRRHQKLIEESPSPALDHELRSRMGEAAIAIGRAIGYTNAGTVEFLLAPSGEFYFIEVNTRIQVEHPVTELVTGIDLVRLQIEIAEGRPLPPQPPIAGHAIEARLNAEDPLNDFLPSTGTVHAWRPPRHVRLDTALEQGAQVGIHYDPLLAKIVSHAADRETALRQLIYALRSTRLQGVETNRDYLIQILESDEFREGRAHTAFLPVPRPEREAPEHLAAAVLFLEEGASNGIPAHYRNNPYRDPSMRLRVRDREISVSWKRAGGNKYLVTVAQAALTVSVAGRTPDSITLEIDGVARTYEIAQAGHQVFVHSPNTSTTITRLPRYPRSAAASQRESANSPMPGQVLRILVQEGQQVKTGDSLVVLEAMKMEQTIRTTINGVVQSVLVTAGQVVAPGQMLVQISAQEVSE